MNTFATHRLDGLEPDNLLAFMALLGLMRALEESQSDWHARVSWTVDAPPLRPLLRVPYGMDEVAVVRAASEGLNGLMELHNFDGISVKMSRMSRECARKTLDAAARNGHPYIADFWSALISDAVIDDKKETVKSTPLRLLDVAQTDFLKSIGKISELRRPPATRGRNINEHQCLQEALFSHWQRRDKDTPTFRWDPVEYVQHALQWGDSTLR